MSEIAISVGNVLMLKRERGIPITVFHMLLEGAICREKDFYWGWNPLFWVENATCNDGKLCIGKKMNFLQDSRVIPKREHIFFWCKSWY